MKLHAVDTTDCLSRELRGAGVRYLGSWQRWVQFMWLLRWGSFATPHCSCKAKSRFWRGSLQGPDESVRGATSLYYLWDCAVMWLCQNHKTFHCLLVKIEYCCLPCLLFLFLNCEVLSRLMDKLPAEQAVFRPLQALINSLLYYFPYFVAARTCWNSSVCACIGKYADVQSTPSLDFRNASLFFPFGSR